MRAKGCGFYADGAVEQYRTMTYEQILENVLPFVSTPTGVIEQINAVDQQIGGLNAVVIMGHLGGLEHRRGMGMQERFAKHVIPAVAPLLSYSCFYLIGHWCYARGSCSSP